MANLSCSSDDTPENQCNVLVSWKTSPEGPYHTKRLDPMWFPSQLRDWASEHPNEELPAFDIAGTVLGPGQRFCGEDEHTLAVAICTIRDQRNPQTINALPETPPDGVKYMLYLSDLHDVEDPNEEDAPVFDDSDSTDIGEEDDESETETEQEYHTDDDEGPPLFDNDSRPKRSHTDDGGASPTVFTQESPRKRVRFSSQDEVRVFHTSESDEE